MTLRETLKSFGLADEQIEEVMRLHGITVQNEQKKTAEETEKTRAALDELTEAKKRLEGLAKEQADTAKLTAEIQEKDAKISALEHDLKNSKISLGISRALTEAGALDYDSVEKLINMDEIDTAEDGTIKGIDKEIKRLKEGEYTGLLFKSDKPVHKDTYPVQTSHGEAKVKTESIGRQAAREANERKGQDNGRKQFFEF